MTITDIAWITESVCLINKIPQIAEIVCIAEEAPGTAHSCPRLMEQELLINCLEEAGGVS